MTSLEEFKQMVIKRTCPYLERSFPLEELQRGRFIVDRINKELSFSAREYLKNNSSLIYYYNSPGQLRRDGIDNDEHFIRFMITKLESLAKREDI